MVNKVGVNKFKIDENDFNAKIATFLYLYDNQDEIYSYGTDKVVNEYDELFMRIRYIISHDPYSLKDLDDNITNSYYDFFSLKNMKCIDDIIKDRKIIENKINSLNILKNMLDTKYNIVSYNSNYISSIYINGNTFIVFKNDFNDKVEIKAKDYNIDNSLLLKLDKNNLILDNINKLIKELKNKIVSEKEYIIYELNNMTHFVNHHISSHY